MGRRINGEYVEAYVGGMTLDDGALLQVKFKVIQRPATFDDPDESERGELSYFIECEQVTRDELPGEVTDHVIERLCHGASVDRFATWGDD